MSHLKRSKGAGITCSKPRGNRVAPAIDQEAVGQAMAERYRNYLDDVERRRQELFRQTEEHIRTLVDNAIRSGMAYDAIWGSDPRSLLIMEEISTYLTNPIYASIVEDQMRISTRRYLNEVRQHFIDSAPQTRREEEEFAQRYREEQERIHQLWEDLFNNPTFGLQRMGAIEVEGAGFIPKFRKSTKKNKKYDVITPSGKILSFGDVRYQHYQDKALGLFSHLDHLDKNRRSKYLRRASRIRDGSGNLTANDPESPNYYSIHFLW